MNKFQIDEHLFYSKMNIRDYKSFNPILCIVKKIEKVKIDGGHSNLIYTVGFVSSIGWDVVDRSDRSDKELNEGCLHRSLDALKEIHRKSTK